MSCYRPNIIFQEFNHSTKKWVTKKFHNSLSKDFQGYEYFDRQNEIFRSLDCFDKRFLRTGCQECVGCVESDSKEWAIRCMMEAEKYESNWFITLTYDDHYLPQDPVVYTRTGEVFEPKEDFGTLVPEDLKKFNHSLRDYFRNNPPYHTGIRFFACGEYGGQTRRPHYHGIYFNLPLPLDDLTVLKVTSDGNVLYRSAILEKIWNKGFVTVANVNYQTCAYVARYVQKKIKVKSNYDSIYTELGQHPEFKRMSNQGGIGKDFYLAHKDEIYDLDEIIFKGSKQRVYPTKPPKYFDNLYGISNPKELEELKLKRRQIAEDNNKVKSMQSTLPEAERLKIEERDKLNKFTAL